MEKVVIQAISYRYMQKKFEKKWLCFKITYIYNHKPNSTSENNPVLLPPIRAAELDSNLPVEPNHPPLVPCLPAFFKS